MTAVIARGVLGGISLATTGLLLLAGCSQPADRPMNRPSDREATTPVAQSMGQDVPGKRSEQTTDVPATNSMNTSEPKSDAGTLPNNTRPVDNSGQNKVDKDGASLTPMDQGTSESDIAITQAARKSLTGDSSLSINAQNLKIITRDGVVFLRGPVASRVEADAVLAHVRTITGVTRVENQIAVP